MISKPEHNRSVVPLYTTQEVAELLGMHPASVRRLAIKHNIGRKLSDRVRVFRSADIDRLRQRKTTTSKARKESQ
jgi:DNA-binding transcriptional MerR regulator